MKFAKGSEHNYTDDIFRIVNVIRRMPRPVYKMEDLYGMLIEGQLYGEELTPVRVTKPTVYNIEKIIDKRYKNGNIEYLVH